jgi:hypothetical protein
MLPIPYPIAPAHTAPKAVHAVSRATIARLNSEQKADERHAESPFKSFHNAHRSIAVSFCTYCEAVKVLQEFMLPVVRPCLNHCTRWAEVPWVNFSGMTSPWVIFWM